MEEFRIASEVGDGAGAPAVLVRGVGSDLGQGFYLVRPAPVSEIFATSDVTTFPGGRTPHDSAA